MVINESMLGSVSRAWREDCIGMGWIELIFFRAECILLCFGFATKGMPKLSLSSAHSTSRPAPSQAAVPARRTELQKSWKGTQPGQLATSGCRDVLYHMLFPVGGKTAERSTFSVRSCKFFILLCFHTQLSLYHSDPLPHPAGGKRASGCVLLAARWCYLQQLHRTLLL